MDINITPTPTGFTVTLSAEGYPDKPYSFSKKTQVQGFLNSLFNVVDTDFEGALTYSE